MRSLCFLREGTVQKLRNQWMGLNFLSGYVNCKPPPPQSPALFSKCVFDVRFINAYLYTLSYLPLLTFCSRRLRKLARTVVIWGKSLTFIYSDVMFRLVYCSSV
jgi:hypothetical protein